MTAVHIAFASDDLAELFEHGTGKCARILPPVVIDRFFNCMAQVAAADDERHLRQYKSRRMEKVPSECRDCYSMRLNDQFRIIFTLEPRPEGITYVVRDVKDYH